MQSLDLTELDGLLKRWDTLLQSYPKAKGTVLERIGEELLEEVRRNIDNAGMHIERGNLAKWQSYYVGSKQGYAAVRAVGSAEGYSPGPNSPGAITNYTENGHRVRPPSRSRGGTWEYRRRVKKPSVDGYHYYHRSRQNSEGIALQELKQFVAELAQRLGGVA